MSENDTEAVQLQTERGCTFDAGRAFYRAESAAARDLAILAARLHRRRTGRLRVLDAMCGSGMRAARYLTQAGAQEVWSNDMDTRNAAAMAFNMEQGLGRSAAREVTLPGLRRPLLVLQPSAPGAAACTGRVSHYEAKRLLNAAFAAEDYYDLIDVDAFGSDTAAVGPALDAVRFGGLVFLTSTDGFSSGGKRPLRALAAYGCYTRAHPSCNEQGLRMLAGAAVRAGLTRGLVVEPLFSLYSPHGPVFRVMVRVTRGRQWPHSHLGFVGHCHADGETQRVPFRELGSARGKTLSVAGPMWTGPLHDREFVMEMRREAAELGWQGHGFGERAGVKMTGHNRPHKLEELLRLMESEADSALPPWFVLLRDVCRHCGLPGLPPRDALVAALRDAGHAASCSHVESRAIKTSASVAEIGEVCETRLGLAVNPALASRRISSAWIAGLDTAGASPQQTG